MPIPRFDRGSKETVKSLTFITDDIKELNACYRAKAYKATLILAGSILEAVLIDWLSEINQADYFTNDYIVTDRNGRSKYKSP